MDRFDAMRLFARIVERRSFTRAAEDLGLPRSTVTDAVKQLEARLGVRLLQRTTRHVGPTPEGEAYHRRCLAILAEVEAAEAAFSPSLPRGRLRVDVQGTFARHMLLPALPEFLAHYPEIDLHLSEGDRYSDPLREGFDCVLRIGEPQDSRMIGRRIALLPEMTLASPAYLAARPRLRTPADLRTGHEMVGFHSSATGAPMALTFHHGGKTENILLPSRLTVTGVETYFEAARLGLGIIQVPRYHARKALAEGELVEVLPDFPAGALPVSLLYPSGAALAPRVRVFIDWLVAITAPPKGADD